MFKKIMLAAAAATAGLTALPAAASADHGRDGYYERGGYERGYDRGRYEDRRYDDRRGYDRRYRGARYDRSYDGYGYRDDRRYRRCGSGTTGAVIGGAAGALVGRDVARGSRGRYYRRGGDGSTGAIIGGAIGALVGREIARSC